MKKKISVFAIIFLLGISLIFASGSGESKSIRLKVGFPEGLENPIGIMCQEFKKIVEEKTNGEITVDLFPSSQLGGIREMLEATRIGNQEIVICTTGWVSSFVPQMSVLSFPYLFPEKEVAYDLIDGEIGKELTEYGKAAGFQFLGFPEVGYREVTNSIRPIERLEDFKGIKIRMQGDPVQMASLRALGANPVSMDFSELYSALQQKVVDAQENTVTNIALNKFDEVQTYLSYTDIFYDSWVVAMNKNVFDGLTSEQQAIILDAMKEAIDLERRTVAEADAENAKKLEETLIVNTIEPEEKERIIAQARTVYTQFDDLIGADLVDKVMKAAGLR